ncbi:MAG: hypothetical protein J6T54_12530 [Fibrobacter sp.]|nr:hypothetical protein [Fibrobacter sp.]
MKKIELTMSNGTATLKIVSDGKKTDVEVFGNTTATQRKAVAQIKDKCLDAITTLRLLYSVFNT